MTKYTDQQRIARAFLTESMKSIEHHRRIQDGYIRTAIRYRLPVEDIAELTGRTAAEVEGVASE